jgi:anaerobic selenocysteine-containing dehydrogenase
MTSQHYRSCPLCEASCGLALTREGDQVVDIVGDEQDSFSRGYLCPKGVALGDLHHDPDRLRHPMIRTGTRWREASWDEALELVGRRIHQIQAAHGRAAFGVVQGNPSVHNLGLITFGPLLLRALDTPSRFSATSLDQLPHMLAALQMFGSQLLMPVPDLDRTDLMIIVGGNPLASNGSIMTAPDMRGRLRAIQDRGGQVVVIDPRRTETAARADRHLFIRPGSDAVLLLAMGHVLFTEGLVRLGRLAEHATGLEELRAACAPWPPERAEPITGVAAVELRALARQLAHTRRAVLYGRLGVCAQEFGGLSGWLCYAINALAGHLDEEGGLMFTTPAADLQPLVGPLGFTGSFATRRSRVSGQPEFCGEWPMATLAEEIETPGPAQLRGVLTLASNPVLSVPNGRRLERAFEALELLVAVDPYLNETTRLAHVILPPTSALERSHYDLILNHFTVRNVAKYSPPMFPRGDDQRHDWEICLELWARIGDGGAAGAIARAARRLGKRALHRLGPDGALDLLLRAGPYGLRRGKHGLSLRTLREAPHGLDLGPLEARLPERLQTAAKKVALAPAVFLGDLPRLEARFRAAPGAREGLVLIGRRQLRSNNSWMHNSERLVKGRERCTVMMHPDDARARGLAAGSRATVATKIGAIELPVELSTDLMPGVISVPHGWGHGRAGSRLAIANAHAGASLNDITDDAAYDTLSGTSALTGLPVEVRAASAATGATAATAAPLT